MPKARKRFSLAVITLLVLGVCLAAAALAQTQSVYTGLYWISGSVVAGDTDQSVDGRRVVFYREANEGAIVGGYSDGIVGSSGLSGSAGRYILNGLQDWRLNLQPGTYYAAIVLGEDGFGANPVRVEVTGSGFDVAPELRLARGAGLLPPGARPDFGLPSITNIRFGRRVYQRALVARGEQFIISPQTKISANAVSDFGSIDRGQLQMIINEGTAAARTYAYSDMNVSLVAAAVPGSPVGSIDFAVDLAEKGVRLTEGVYNITVRAANVFGVTSEVCTVTVKGGEAMLIGQPLAYPSPLNLGSDTSVTFQYTLSQDVPVDIHVFDVSGQVVWTKLCSLGEEGSAAGTNKVVWTGLNTLQGSTLASGIYVVTLVNKESGKLLGKVKLTAIRR
jgi:hypothetical protein